MADHSRMRLGRLPARHDSRRRGHAHRLFAALPPAPPSVDWTNGIGAWGMMRNDVLGDCTIAACGHAIQVVTLAATDAIVTPSDDVVLSLYEKWDGYHPADPASDQGGVELDVLQDWERDGFDGHALLGFVSPDPRNLDQVKQAITHFGGVYMGAELPVSAQTQEVWDVTPADGHIWGGHCMHAPSYDRDTVSFITWGQRKRATWNWWLKYVDECHALLLQEWLLRYPAATRQEILALLQGCA